MSRYKSCYSLEDNSTSCPIVYERQPHITVTTIRLNWTQEVIDLMRQTQTQLKQFLADWGVDEPDDTDDYERFEAEQDRVSGMLDRLAYAIPEEARYALQDELAQGLHNYPHVLDWMQRVIDDKDVPF